MKIRKPSFIYMNKLFIIMVAGLMFSCNSTSNKSEMYVDITSAESFFRIADKITAGFEITENEWNELFKTQGYRKNIEESFDEKGEFVRKAMDLAYNPSRAAERDSLTSISVEEIVSDWGALLLHVMLNNFIDTKENQTAVKKQLYTINGAKLMADAEKRLKNFLVNPVDSLIAPIPIDIICMEPDALSYPGRIVWDANLFRKQSEEDKVNTLAHEMFHAYRRYFTDKSKAKGLIQLLHLWQNEGIADQIDKKSLSDLSSQFKRLGLPDSYVDEYNEIYDKTPQTLRELEKLTLSFLHGDIDEKKYNSSLDGFIYFGGHPNAYYMSTVIKNAGYEKEMIGTFTSPVKFVELYNKSIAPEDAFGSEFMKYLKKQEGEYLID
ncbi:MAG: hypothetical protein LUH22_20300 [Bacteroides sp.]|nr:hypothetical protein [Bacteroides sp.]